jgi:hypothetical protein
LGGLFFHSGHVIKGLNINSTYSAGSFPAGVCQNIRISRSRIVKSEKYGEHCASKRAYFYGYRVHMTLASAGMPAEFSFTAKRTADIDGFRLIPPDLPDGGKILANAGYLIEGMLADKAIKTFAARKTNSKRKHQPRIECLINKGRKRVEATFSNMNKYIPKKIHAATDIAFLIKIIAFIWAYAFEIIQNL